MNLFDDDIQNILSMVKVEKLEILNLHGNHLKHIKKGEFSILSSLRQMVNLEHLDLGYNSVIPESCVTTELADLLPKLEYLNVQKGKRSKKMLKHN